MGDLFGSGDAADAGIEASEIQASWMKEALAYLQETERLPQGFREAALTQLGGLYGFGVTDPTEQPGEMTRRPIYGDVRVRNPDFSPGGWGRDGGGVPEWITQRGRTGYEDVAGEPGQIPGSVVYTGDTSGQQDLIEQARTSPLYDEIMGGREFGEEAILRSAGATGGLRSGNVQGNLYDYNTRLQNRALLESYNQQLMGLTGLAGLPSNANQIAGMMGGIGQTYGQGIIGAAQSQQDARQQGWGNLIGLGGLGIGTAGLFMASDRRLKSNIQKIGEVNGFNWYTWDWNAVARKMGFEGATIGCLADEVFDIVPEAVTLRQNFMFINYSMIGV